MSLVRRLIQCLEEIKVIDYTNTSRSQVYLNKSKAESAFNLIFEIGRDKIKFSEEEALILGDLLVTIEYLQINVESTANTYRTRLTNSVLKKRSAVQFLIDDYPHIPVKHLIVADKLRASAKKLDVIIDKWQDETDSDEEPSDREEAGSLEVPTSHSWWRK